MHRLTRGGLPFRHWQLYGERGRAGEWVAAWVWNETLTIGDANATLAQYRKKIEAIGHRSVGGAPEPGAGRCLRGDVAPDRVGELLGDSDDGAVEVGAGTAREDRGVGHAQPGDAVDSPHVVNYRPRMSSRPHAAGI